MILIFDLDDTLYDERQFVEGGIKEVAQYIGNKYNKDEKNLFDLMMSDLKENGRGAIFDSITMSAGIYSKKLVKKCIQIYRYHKPCIELNDETKELLNRLRARYPLYLVTDGNKNVQQSKINTLKIEQYFKKVYITHRYGIKNAKPSLYCFNRIKSQEKVGYEDLFYIGDNPNKDFINLNKAGANTIRVLTGNYKNVSIDYPYNAKQSIECISDLCSLL